MRGEYDAEFWERFAVTRPKDPLGLVDKFERLLDKDPPERDVQSFLEDNPWLLSEQLPHCHFILPQFSLGGQYVPDFIAPERSSGGTQWFLIEIEKPRAQLVTKKGLFAETVRHAIQQVQDWKMWLNDNQDIARKPRLEGGLGLDDMSRILIGQVIVGRRSDVTPRYNQLREQLMDSDAIQIITYDHMTEWLRERANFWAGFRPL